MTAAAAKTPPKKETIGIAAFPEEIERWKRQAHDVQRPLSQWLRLQILKAEAADRAEGHLPVGGQATK